MTRVRFIHTSDLQLGMSRWFLGTDGQAVFDDDRLAAVRRLGELATETEAEFIVVAGDVFEHNSLSERVIGRALEELRALPVPVYLLPGNHDPLVADNIFRRTENVAGVHVVDSTEPIQVREGVEILGVPWRSKFPTGDQVRVALEAQEPTDAVRIGLAHGQTESFGDELAPGLIDLSYVESRIADGTIDYLALGDSHSTASLSSTGAVWFSGSPETTDFAEPGGGGEADSGNALVVTIEKSSASAGATVDVVKHEVGRWQFEALADELYGEDDVDAFLELLDSYPEKSRTVLKYALTGTLSLTDTQRLQDGIDARRHVFTALYERERLMDLHLEPGEEEIDALSVGGVAAGALAELFDDADDQVARDAVNLMFRLAKEA